MAVLKNEIMKLAGKWMELGNVLLNKVTQAENDKERVFSRHRA